MDPDAAYFQGMYSGVLSIQSESRSESLAGTLKKPTRVHLEGMRHGLCKLAKPERSSQSDHPRAISFGLLPWFELHEDLWKGYRVASVKNLRISPGQGRHC